MLVLGRFVGQGIMIGDQTEITVERIARSEFKGSQFNGDNYVRLGFNAPPDIQILRKELYTPPAAWETPNSSRKVQIKVGVRFAGRIGEVIGSFRIINKQSWTPLVWEGEEDPSWYKTDCLEPAKIAVS